MAPNVQLLAISFPDAASAATAEAMLVRVFGPGGSMHMAPLGEASYPVRERSLLVGRFQDDVIAAVRAAVREAGGTIEMDIPETAAR